MASTTVTEIIERAQAAADMHDNFVTSTQWLRWLNVEYRALALFILRSGYVFTENTETITANGSLTYEFNEPLVILGVYEYKDQRYRRIEHSDMMDGAGNIDEVTTGPARFFRVYQAASGKVGMQLWPIPQSGTYKVRKVVIPVAVTLTDSIELPAGFEERLVLGLARRALAKEESSTAEISRQVDEADRYIEEMCFDRVMAAHQSVRNVDKVERGWFPYPQYPTRERWYWI
jgi:hypothetical protein